MSRLRNHWYFWIGTVILGVTCACGLASTGASSSSTGNAASSGNNAPSSSQNFPLTPNPINVQLTLDTTPAVSDEGRARVGVANPDQLSGTDAKGTSFNFGIPEGLLTQEADGTIDPAFGTAVTVRPVSAINGIPFAKGFVSAFQFGPEGLLMGEPGTAELNIKGDYNDLVGFASNGDGTDFHLIPINASPGGGFTIVTFNILHYSMYGVAEATAAEVTAQHSQPPSDPDSQDDDLLAAPASLNQQALSKEHDRLLKAALANLNACNNVVKASRNFMKWYGNVQSGGQQNYFKDMINTDSNTLISRLKDCLQISCPLCLQNKKPDKKSVNALLVQAYYLEAIDLLTGNAPDANYYRALASKCAQNAGLPDPSPHVAECTGTDCQQITPTELACPAP